MKSRPKANGFIAPPASYRMDLNWSKTDLECLPSQTLIVVMAAFLVTGVLKLLKLRGPASPLDYPYHRLLLAPPTQEQKTLYFPPILLCRLAVDGTGDVQMLEAIACSPSC